MRIDEILSETSIVPSLKASSKKQVLQELAERIALQFDIPQRVLFDTLLQREKLGSTGVGNGIAIPHGKFLEIDRIIGFFARLDKKVDFDSIDDEPVDLIFVLLVPENSGTDHLKALAKVSRILREKAIVSKLRMAKDRESLFITFNEYDHSSSNAA